MPPDVAPASFVAAVDRHAAAARLTLAAGYANKARCVGPAFDARAAATPDYGVRITRDVCYSDIQFLWIGRDIDRHVFPYVHGGYDPATEQLYGGAVEYPVLTGMAI